MKYTDLNPDKINPAGWYYESDNGEHYIACDGDNGFDSDGRYIARIDGFRSKAQAMRFMWDWCQHREHGGKS